MRTARAGCRAEVAIVVAIRTRALAALLNVVVLAERSARFKCRLVASGAQMIGRGAFALRILVNVADLGLARPRLVVASVASGHGVYVPRAGVPSRPSPSNCRGVVVAAGSVSSRAEPRRAAGLLVRQRCGIGCCRMPRRGGDKHSVEEDEGEGESAADRRNSSLRHRGTTGLCSGVKGRSSLIISWPASE